MIRINDRNRGLMLLLERYAEMPTEPRKALYELAQRMGDEPMAALPGPTYLNPDKLPLPPTDEETLIMRCESKEKLVDDLLAQIGPVLTEEPVQGLYEEVPRKVLKQRVVVAIMDAYLSRRYLGLNLVAMWARAATGG